MVDCSLLKGEIRLHFNVRAGPSVHTSLMSELEVSEDAVSTDVSAWEAGMGGVGPQTGSCSRRQQDVHASGLGSFFLAQLQSPMHKTLAQLPLRPHTLPLHPPTHR